MNTTEIPVTFDCEGDTLVGMVHQPAEVRGRGVLAVVAGGPQYRGGVCRMQVDMARELAAAGIPVMRFDYRGIGDSEGEFKGFCHVQEDLRAALEAFTRQVPEMPGVVLWGGCDAASAAMINGWKFPQVHGLALGNPWVHSEETGDAVAVQHYSQRLRDLDFWLKVIRLQYNPLPAVATILRNAAQRLTSRLGSQSPVTATPAHPMDDPNLPFQSRMLVGLQQFKGDVLLLMSGRSLLSKEFDELAASQPAWQQALQSPQPATRVDIADADQAFSNISARAEVTQRLTDWIGATSPATAAAAAPFATGPAPQ